MYKVTLFLVLVISNGFSIQKPELLNLKKTKTKTKQIATIGPSVDSYDQLYNLHKNGVSIFRINLSHGKYDKVIEWVDILNKIKSKSDDELNIMVDLQGPKHRIGNIKNCMLEEGNEFILDRDTKIGNNHRVNLPHDEIYFHVKENDIILLDDGLLELKVKDCVENSRIITEVIRGGELKSKKGFNIPYVDINWIKPTPKDEKDINFINELNIDYVAVSFVDDAKDIFNIWRLLRNKVKIIAKIERPNAVDNLDEIIDSSDGIMIARGDLGIEMGIEKVPFIQKLAIKKALKEKCEVFVATQMMESMINNKIPTRAEVSDIANAVLDGATGVMLSAETSVGKYPIDCVKIQRKILDETAQYL